MFILALLLLINTPVDLVLSMASHVAEAKAACRGHDLVVIADIHFCSSFLNEK